MNPPARLSDGDLESRGHPQSGGGAGQVLFPSLLLHPVPRSVLCQVLKEPQFCCSRLHLLVPHLPGTGDHEISATAQNPLPVWLALGLLCPIAGGPSSPGPAPPITAAWAWIKTQCMTKGNVFNSRGCGPGASPSAAAASSKAHAVPFAFYYLSNPLTFFQACVYSL